MDVSQYMGMFMDESHEHLQALNQCLLGLEKTPADLGLVNEIFRVAHTLKGMAATMGFSKIADLTHKMENTLDQIRTGETFATEKLIDLLFKCLDSLEILVDDVVSQVDSNVDVVSLMQELENFSVQEDVKASETFSENDVNSSSLELSVYEKDIIEQAIKQNFNTYHIKVKITDDCLLKSARAYMVFKNLEEIGEILSSDPSSQDIEDEKFENEFSIIFVTKEENSSVESHILSISEIESADIKDVSVDKLDDHEKASMEKMIPNNITTGMENEKKDNLNHKNEKIKTTQTVRVDIQRLDYLNNLVQEMVISKTRLDQIKTHNDFHGLGETVEHIGRITTDLQDIVMKIRMVPVEQVFNRFPRMVRDLAKDLNKKINLVIEGQETELDRTIIDEIGDPLVHLLRNSIDHGLESTEERLAAGKDEVGTVRLVAYHKGDSILIEVEDDGKGIDPDVIRSKAVEKELLTEKEAIELDDKAAVKLIFKPGFSTAKEVTEVSGRGVGLDAVETQISSLGGFVDVETEKGKGSQFIIRLPLTLAIIQALLIRINQEIYAIPLSFIDETITMNPQDIKTIQRQETILLRGEVLPLVRLSNVLNILEQDEDNQDEDLYIVIVRKGNQRAGLVVDDLIGQQEIVIKSLGDLIGGIKGIAGATILGDGHVALILDIGGII